MWFQKFLIRIIEGKFGKFLDKKVDAINKTVPSRIYLENVRTFFGTNRWVAKSICDLAVAEGAFIKKIGLECPNEGRIVISYNEGETIDENVVCDLCESSGEEQFQFKSKDMPHIQFYQLVE